MAILLGEKFDMWFVDCIIAGANNSNCPDEYVWNIEEQRQGGIWLEMFNAGLSPEIAVSLLFDKVNLND